MTIRSLKIILTFLAVLFLTVGTASGKEIHNIKANASSFKEWGIPGFLVDGDISTAWVGGRKGVGPGKTLSFTLPKKTTIGMIRIANGNQGKDKFKEFRSVTSGILVLQDQGVHHFTLKPVTGEQGISFPPVAVSSFAIIIDEVSPLPGDSSMGDAKVAVSEVRVFSKADSTATQVSSKPLKKKAKTVTPQTTKTDKFTATKTGRLVLQTMVPVAMDTPLTPGIIDPQAAQEFVALIRDYFDRLATMRDSYTEVFIASIQDREHAALARLRQVTQTKKNPVPNAKAIPDNSGLNFDKPIVRGYAAMIRTHGNYRINIGKKAYQSPVNALFSFAKENGVWLINGVQSR